MGSQTFQSQAHGPSPGFRNLLKVFKKDGSTYGNREPSILCHQALARSSTDQRELPILYELARENWRVRIGEELVKIGERELAKIYQTYSIGLLCQNKIRIG